MTFPVVRAASRLAPLAMVILALQGCAALPLAGVGASVLGAGAGEVVKVGTEYTTGGTVHRTVAIPMNEVLEAVLGAFERTGIEVTKHTQDEGEEHFTGQLRHRKVHVDVVALSEELTTLKILVERNVFSKDRATTSELLEQVEQVLAENPQFALRLHRRTDDVAPAAGVRFR
jgi:hypothetical protein